MGVEGHDQSIGKDAGDAAGKNTEGEPACAAENAQNEADALFFGETKGGCQAKDHTDPVRSLVFKQTLHSKTVTRATERPTEESNGIANLPWSRWLAWCRNRIDP